MVDYEQDDGLLKSPKVRKSTVKSITLTPDIEAALEEIRKYWLVMNKEPITLSRLIRVIVTKYHKTLKKQYARYKIMVEDDLYVKIDDRYCPILGYDLVEKLVYIAFSNGFNTVTEILKSPVIYTLKGGQYIKLPAFLESEKKKFEVTGNAPDRVEVEDILEDSPDMKIKIENVEKEA